MGPQSSLKIQKEWCRYWIRSHYGFEQRSALVLLISEERPGQEDSNPISETDKKGTATTSEMSTAIEKTLYELRWQFAQPVFVHLKVPLKSHRDLPKTTHADCAIDDLPARCFSALDHSEAVSSASDLCAWICASDSLLLIESPQDTDPIGRFGWLNPIAEVAYGFGKPLNVMGLSEGNRQRCQSTADGVRNADSASKGWELSWERLHQSSRETLAITLDPSDWRNHTNPGFWTYEQGLQRLENAWRLACGVAVDSLELSREQRKVA